MADVNISELPALTAAQISDKADIRFPVDDLQSTPATKQLALDELETALASLVPTVTFNQTTIPSGSDDPGIYFVQTGTDRGVYAWSGVEAIRLAPFSQDGDWPV